MSKRNEIVQNEAIYRLQDNAMLGITMLEVLKRSIHDSVVRLLWL